MQALANLMLPEACWHWATRVFQISLQETSMMWEHEQLLMHTASHQLRLATLRFLRSLDEAIDITAAVPSARLAIPQQITVQQRLILAMIQCHERFLDHKVSWEHLLDLLHHNPWWVNFPVKCLATHKRNINVRCVTNDSHVPALCKHTCTAIQARSRSHAMSPVVEDTSLLWVTCVVTRRSTKERELQYRACQMSRTAFPASYGDFEKITNEKTNFVLSSSTGWEQRRFENGWK